MDKKYFSEIVLLTKTYNPQDFADWLHWHIDVVKIDHIVVFDNESPVNIKTICNKYSDKVQYERVIGWPNQYSLYNTYINDHSSAEWVLPIDDDEFLWISDKFSDINKALSFYKNQWPDMLKFSIGWRNLFPVKYQDVRSKPIIENATAWSDIASSFWQSGNKPVKTAVLTTDAKYLWISTPGFHNAHNPLVIDDFTIKSYTSAGERITESTQLENTKNAADLILYHYQYKSNNEWLRKCSIGSPASKLFSAVKQQQIDAYAKLYNYYNTFKIDNRMIDSWTTLVK